jgi:hypothetical protein
LQLGTVVEPEVIFEVPVPKFVEGNRIQQSGCLAQRHARVAAGRHRPALEGTGRRTPGRSDVGATDRDAVFRHRHAAAVVHRRERDTEPDAAPFLVADRVRTLPVLDGEIRRRVPDDTIDAVGNFHANRMRPGQPQVEVDRARLDPR